MLTARNWTNAIRSIDRPARVREHHDLPVTWTGQRMHAMSVDCWCQPALSEGQDDGGRVVMVRHHPEVRT